jgi:nitroreductase
MDTNDNQTRALIAATTVAGVAPSIHNTQPWHWRIKPGVAELSGDEARWLGAADPDRRLLTLSCGAALHHACVALAAEGYTAEVWRTDADGSPQIAGPLATLTVTGTTAVTPAAMRHMQTIEIRHTDRRPLLDAPVPADAIEAMRTAANACDIGWHTLDRDAVLELAAATSRAQRDQVADAATQAELDAWTGGRSPAGTGVPDTAIPARSPQTTVPARDFGHVGTLDVPAGHDRQAVYAILYAAADDPRHWLRGGEALSAMWLAATEHNLAFLPLSAAIEELSTRQVLRRLISNLGYPLIAVRLGIADPNVATAAHTPRLQADETVEVVD